MFVRPCSLIVVASVGCAPTGPPLSRLVQAWAAETAEHASDPLTGTLVLAALTAELCSSELLDSLGEVENNTELSLSPQLQDALGAPKLYSLEYSDAGVGQMMLSGVDIAGRTGQWLRVTLTTQEEQILAEYAALVDEPSGATEPARLDGFGQISLHVGTGCTNTRSMVGGSALWVDEENRRHEVKIPADQELGSDLVFGSDRPWIPVSGAISWEARIENQRRTVTTEDAAEIRMSEDGESRWPVDVYGPDWSGTALTTIAP